MNYTDPSGHICVESDDDSDVGMAGNCHGGSNPKYKRGLQGSSWQKGEREWDMSDWENFQKTKDKCSEIPLLCSSSATGNFPINDTSPSYEFDTKGFDDIVTFFQYGYKTISALDMIETAEHLGIPAYKQIKYAAPLSGLEIGGDMALQSYEDRNKDINYGQRVLRVGVRGLESLITDGLGNLAGTRAVASGTGPVGFVVAAYSTSATIDNTITNEFNPWLFSYPIFGGTP